MPQEPSCVRFVPSALEGDAGDISHVTVHPDRLELERPGQPAQIVRFADIACRQEPRLASLLRRLALGLFGPPRPPLVADRDAFHPAAQRRFRFYTTPPLVVCIPTDELDDYGASTFVRVRLQIARGGYDTWDQG